MKRNQSSLSSRLNRLKSKESNNVNPLEKKEFIEQSRLKTIYLQGWNQIDDFVWKRKIYKKNLLRSKFIHSLLVPMNCLSDNLIFYDTETTGLSSGAGTIAFLIGLGQIRSDKFVLTQYFLADHRGEHTMLQEIKKDFSKASHFVSYNGKSYDSHLLNTRFLMNRIQIVNREEIDLMYICRRLWKDSLENCRLSTIEENILHLKRGADIPGSEIPDVWFQFLKNGNLEKLELVFNHNLQDIYSLSLILEKIESISENLPDDNEYNRFALAKDLMKIDRSKSIKIIEQEIHRGNKEACKYLSLFYKRMGQWDKSIPLWEIMNRRGVNIFATIELAKYYEHIDKNPIKALKIINPLIKGPLKSSGIIYEELIHRKKRLKNKIEINQNL